MGSPPIYNPSLEIWKCLCFGFLWCFLGGCLKFLYHSKWSQCIFSSLVFLAPLRSCSCFFLREILFWWIYSLCLWLLFSRHMKICLPLLSTYNYLQEFNVNPLFFIFLVFRGWKELLNGHKQKKKEKLLRLQF